MLFVLAFIFQVLPSVLQCLPLKEDFEENKTVFDCLCQLYLSGEQEVKKALEFKSLYKD